MPTGTKVDRCYQKVKREGHSEGSAARICQSSTGESLQTGRPPKGKSFKITRTKMALPFLGKGTLGKRKGTACCQSCKAGRPCDGG